MIFKYMYVKGYFSNSFSFLLHNNTTFDNIAPGVYQWTEYRPWQAPCRKVAVIKGFDVAIYDN